MSIFNKSINSLPKSGGIALLLAADLLLVCLDNMSGPFLPFTIFYVMLIYLGITRVDKSWAYVVVLLSALGRTYVASQVFPSSTYLVFFAWQFATSASVLFIICYLLDITHRKGLAGNAQAAPLQNSPTVSTTCLMPADAHYVLCVSASAQHDRKSRKTAMKVLLTTVGILLVALTSLRGGAISDAYAVDAGYGHVVVNPAFEVPLASDQAMLEKIVVLTIDDGPRTPAADRQILDILKRHSAKAVWLVNCNHFDPATNPNAAESLKTLLQIQHEGHPIGNHSYNHLDLRDLAKSDHARMVWEIEQCSAAIESATGSRPKYFRAPFGAFTPEIVSVAHSSGMLYMQWSIGYDSLFHYLRPAAGDRPASADEIRELADSVENGAIILMHDDQRMADSLDVFLTNLERRGYKFVLPQSNPEVSAQI